MKSLRGLSEVPVPALWGRGRRHFGPAPWKKNPGFLPGSAPHARCRGIRFDRGDIFN
jgi:hypothetical protein